MMDRKATGKVVLTSDHDLAPTYPLYLANKAEQPNTDLAVTDKFTGEVATRVALADAAMIDRGHRRSGARRPSRWRAWRPTSGRRC